MAGHTCEGCDKFFTTVRGYLSHLDQTRDVLCQQIRDTIRRRRRPRRRQRSNRQEGTSSDEDSSATLATPVFQGDLFGSAPEYMNDHFGQHEDTEHLDVPDESPSDHGGDEAANSDQEAEMVAQLEDSWEAERQDAPRDGPQHPDHENPAIHTERDELEAEAVLEARQAETVLIGEGHGIKPKVTIRYSDAYPSSQAGQPLSQQEATDARYSAALGSGDWAPFNSKMDWEIARWAKLRGPGSTAFSNLLAIDGVREALNLSYKTSEELNRVIDTKLPGRPQFHRHEVVMHGEAMEFYARDVMECLRALWGDPDFVGEMIFEPECHYADDDERIRLYHGMETGKWWWRIQKKVESTTGQKKCTIVPIIISSDKTQLTQFRNKSAYPPSRQGQVLLAYLPTSRLEHVKNQASRRRSLANLFHRCMKHILEPLEVAGRTGVVLVGGDGVARRCYPIYAVFVGDYPEQVLVTLVKTGKCPVCPAAREGIGNLDSICKPREIGPIRNALMKAKDGPTAFTKACAAVGIKPVQDPFWLHLPYLNIYKSITPDILHQVYQGVFKHVLTWIYSACGESEIDARCRRLPPNHNIRLFMKGITQLSRVTGTEHDQICRFILGLIVDIRLPDGLSNARLVRAVRSLLDFIYLAKYPIHSSQTLDNMDQALQNFHDNLDIFVDLGIREHFDIPKFHFTGHFRPFVELYGTTDNFNTEYTERLHIDMAKDAYAATNRKDEYAQMTLWLERREKILQHEKYTQRRMSAMHAPQIIKPLPSLIPLRHQLMTKHPTVAAVSLDDIREKYGASHFESALARFVVQYQHPTYSKAQVAASAASFHIPFYQIPVFHRLKFWSNDVYALDPLAQNIVDSLHVEPAHFDKYNKVVPGRFDVALVNFKNGGASGVKGYCAAQVRCIFSLPKSALERWFPQGFPHKHLAYVEWFTPFSNASLELNSKLYRISPLMSPTQHTRETSIIPISLIRQSIQLYPKFGPVAPADWKSSNVLDMASIFYVNPFSDRFQYSTIY
ncbi:hypothetical protein BJ912DRAFT_1024283 [Pholiota molesta]|nr:hypothetical protein BJ912DRAFT_1024283 [Pholiota molesta]